MIGNRLCELERDKDLLNRFRLHKDQREEQGFQQMDSGKIPELRLHIPSVSNPSKKQKISETTSQVEDPPVVVIPSEEGTIEE